MVATEVEPDFPPDHNWMQEDHSQQARYQEDPLPLSTAPFHSQSFTAMEQGNEGNFLDLLRESNSSDYIPDRKASEENQINGASLPAGLQLSQPSVWAVSPGQREVEMNSDFHASQDHSQAVTPYYITSTERGQRRSFTSHGYNEVFPSHEYHNVDQMEYIESIENPRGDITSLYGSHTQSTQRGRSRASKYPRQAYQPLNSPFNTTGPSYQTRAPGSLYVDTGYHNVFQGGGIPQDLNLTRSGRDEVNEVLPYKNPYNIDHRSRYPAIQHNVKFTDNCKFLGVIGDPFNESKVPDHEDFQDQFQAGGVQGANLESTPPLSPKSSEGSYPGTPPLLSLNNLESKVGKLQAIKPKPETPRVKPKPGLIFIPDPRMPDHTDRKKWPNPGKQRNNRIVSNESRINANKVKKAGGACKDCKRGHKKCSLSHLPITPISQQSSPIFTPESIATPDSTQSSAPVLFHDSIAGK